MHIFFHFSISRALPPSWFFSSTTNPKNSRSFAKLSPVTKFDDLVADMGADRVNLLKTVYANVNDIDLYVGILMEKPMNGALVLSEKLVCNFAKTISRLGRPEVALSRNNSEDSEMETDSILNIPMLVHED